MMAFRARKALWGERIFVRAEIRIETWNFRVEVQNVDEEIQKVHVGTMKHKVEAAIPV